ncbi:MAG: VWA domain-containing protein [Phycisphaeraceae bacterium]|nr:VWA domain-containing protein [Phycisphaerales bacterium]QOJ17901.1 MAG: VWA domain-containing protein [Phycisphaeraceae bacterium]
MFENLFIRFEQPTWLALSALVLPMYLIARTSLGGLSPLKTHVTFAVRAIVVVLLAASLAEPTWMKKGEGLTVVVMMDRSRSVPQYLRDRALDYMKVATTLQRRPEDRLGIITIGKGAAISSLPHRFSSFDNFTDNLASDEATTLAEGLSLALATAPQDTMIRFVLVSDGNETDGHVLEAAKAARANGIPIDVLPLTYEHGREVIFDRLVAPARVREGQVSSLRMVLRAQSEVTGVLSLTQNGLPVDLDPESPGATVRVRLQPGLNSRNIPILYNEAGPQQFEATFVPDDPQADLIAENNRAVAVTFVGGEGRVLILADSEADAEPLAAALRASDLSVRTEQASYLDSIVTLGGYDAVIMMDQHRRDYTTEQDKWLHDYVHDLGGGLLVLGGPQAFGNGGWISSQVEKALPVKLDPPQTMQRQLGALCLIMHSCEMPQANFWGQKVAISAIEALSSQDYVGILDYNWNAGGVVWEYGPAPAGDKSRPIAAAQKMPVGDMPDFQSAMQLAYDGMAPLNANKHCIIISDGDPSPPSQALLDQFVAAKITVTTVLIAGHGGPTTMQTIANVTGGNFYNVTNPRNLPEIFISESRIVARSLTVEGDEYIPTLQNPLVEPIRGFRDLPSVDGYVLTAPKEGLAEIAFVSDKHGDPIYASWNYGIGKAIAFTPDLTGRWGGRWVGWDRFKGFWDQSVRWAMRPVSPSNMTVNTRLEGERAIIEVEAFDKDSNFENFLTSSAAVLGPDGTAPLALQQVGPGRYRGEFDAAEAGAYLVNMHFRKGGEIVGNMQAAVNVPYSREFRAIRDDSARLVQVAEMTGGRVLRDQPQLADLWNRDGLEPRRSHKPIWDLLAIIAASIFLVDVAGRRLAIGIAEVRQTLRKMLGRRGDVAEDTVAAWKRAREQVAHRKQPGGPTEPAAAARDIPVEDRTVKFEASEQDRGKAIDVGADVAASGVPSDRPAAPRRRPVAEKPDPTDEGDFTSRLLAAKRRAREQQKGESDGGVHG